MATVESSATFEQLEVFRPEPTEQGNRQSISGTSKPASVGCFPAMSRWFKRPAPATDEKENLALPTPIVPGASSRRSSILSTTRHSSSSAPPTPATTEEDFPLTSPSQCSDSDPINFDYDSSLVPPCTPALLSPPLVPSTSASSSNQQSANAFDAFVYRGGFALDPEDPLMETSVPTTTSETRSQDKTAPSTAGRSNAPSTASKGKRRSSDMLSHVKRPKVTTVPKGQFTLSHFAYSQGSL